MSLLTQQRMPRISEAGPPICPASKLSLHRTTPALSRDGHPNTPPSESQQYSFAKEVCREERGQHIATRRAEALVTRDDVDVPGRAREGRQERSSTRAVCCVVHCVDTEPCPGAIGVNDTKTNARRT